MTRIAWKSNPDRLITSNDQESSAQTNAVTTASTAHSVSVRGSVYLTVPRLPPLIFVRYVIKKLDSVRNIASADAIIQICKKWNEDMDRTRQVTEVIETTESGNNSCHVL